ncbi:uncharacterized protein [Amphiura filiformis]|uniref:uncharacterized protein n=1 Tax=Amphiura filiformis TaxID=82378 RepID=UPI003B21CEF8
MEDEGSMSQMLSRLQLKSSSTTPSPACPPAYFTWLDSMYTQFGGRFFRLFRGPYYEGIPPDHQYPWNCKFNVACISPRAIQKQRTLQQERNEHLFSSDTSIQVNALKEVVKTNPGGRYWIKSDATDLNPCLQESGKHDWFGDADLGDGKVKEMHDEYITRLADVTAMSQSGNEQNLTTTLKREMEQLKKNVIEITSGLEKARKEFTTKSSLEKTSMQKLKNLCWTVHEHEVILEQLNEASDTLTSLKKQLLNGKHTKAIAEAVCEYKADYHKLLRNCYGSYSCYGVCHIARRAEKETLLYPCEVVSLMVSSTPAEIIGLDGQPTSIFRFRQLARNKVAHMPMDALLRMLLTKEEVLQEVQQLHANGVSLEAILAQIRSKLLKPPHKLSLWPGEEAGEESR